jgi:hypothetical protein
MNNSTKKLYDCYTRLDNLSAKQSDDKEGFIKVTVIKDDNGFALKIHGRNFLRDSSAEGAFQEFLNTYSNSSVEMILDELGYIPQRYLGKDEEEFILWRRAFVKKVRDIAMKKASWTLDD